MQPEPIYRPVESDPTLPLVIDASGRMVKITSNFTLFAQGSPIEQPVSRAFQAANDASYNDAPYVEYGAVRLMQETTVNGVHVLTGSGAIVTTSETLPEGSLLLVNEQGEWFGVCFSDQMSLKTLHRLPWDNDDTSKAVSVVAPKDDQWGALQHWDDNEDKPAQLRDVESLRTLGLGY